MSSAFFYLAYSAAGAVAIAFASNGGLARVAPPILVFGILPALDELLSRDRSQPVWASDRRVYDWPLRTWVVVQLGLIAWGVGIAPSMSYGGGATLALSLGVVTGAVGITVAHELMHRKEKLDRFLAETLMSSVLYAHFCVEHVFGHHRFVGLQRDPATARLGESVFRFLPRSIGAGLVSAWHIESSRRQALGDAGSLRDARWRWTVVPALTLSIVGVAAGGRGVFFFVLQAVAAILMLELVNYLEHYGLSRRTRDDGRVEVVSHLHSWNSGHLVSGIFLFRLTRHSDHHQDASREYERLALSSDASPQLPFGYATMILLALCPPLWFRVMNPRALQFARVA